MVNMKAKVYQALCGAFEEKDVSDSWPESMEQIPCIVYTEEENKSYERTGSRTTKSYCRFRIDLFAEAGASTSETAAKTDAVLAWNEDGTGLGMTRTGCQDNNSKDFSHKIMRYECIVGETDEKIYGI